MAGRTKDYSSCCLGKDILTRQLASFSEYLAKLRLERWGDTPWAGLRDKGGFLPGKALGFHGVGVSAARGSGKCLET